jgi:uncharacterized protein (UPF0335 family)
MSDKKAKNKTDLVEDQLRAVVHRVAMLEDRLRTAENEIRDLRHTAQRRGDQ